MSSLNLRKILVAVADPSLRSNKAVKRAAELAHRSGAAIELFNSVTSSAVSIGVARAEAEEFSRAAMALNAHHLERMARPLRREELIVTTAVQTGYAVHEAILRQARLSAADLVVIEAHKHNVFARLLLSQTDFELIRRCPVPLLIVKGRAAWRSPRILAALDPFHSGEKPSALDATIVDAARGLADLMRGSVHATYVSRPLMNFIPGVAMDPSIIAVTPAQDKAYEGNVRRHFSEAATRYGISAKNRHLRFGDPAIELPAQANSLRAGAVVMGAISRSGLKRIFIGQTAERVLDSLKCDLLIVKPAGFRAPN